MKLNKVLPFIAVASFCLAGCASKCDYAKFHEKATAVKAHSYKKASVKINSSSNVVGVSVELKGTVKYIYNGGWELDANDDNGAAVQAASLVYILQTAAGVGEDENYEYYAGSSFKVVVKDSKATTEFNGFGLLTSYKDNNTKVSISYSK